MSYPTARDIAKVVARLKPGQRITISRLLLMEISGLKLHPFGSFSLPTRSENEWTPAEQVMENIIGASYEFRFWEHGPGGDVTFERLPMPLTDGSRTYVSPDQRHYVSRGEDGFYWPVRERGSPEED